MTQSVGNLSGRGRKPAEEDRRIWQIRSREGPVMLRRGFLLTVGAVFLLACYTSSQFRGLDQPQAMEQAQIGRNLARGEGFTTQFIRPMGIWQLNQHAKRHGLLPDLYPDLMNPPAYPALIAAFFTLVQKGGLLISQQGLTAPGKASWAAALLGWPWWWLVWLGGAVMCFASLLRGWKRVWLQPGGIRWHMAGIVVCLFVMTLLLLPEVSFQVQPRATFKWFGPDMLLVLGLGLPLTVLNGWLTYLIARRLFDRRVGVMAGCLFVLSETVCQYAVSGLSVPLTMAWAGGAWLALLAASHRAEQGGGISGIRWRALVAAALIAGALLTQYSAGLLLLPALLFVWWTTGLRRGLPMVLWMILVFAVIATPWLIRNQGISGGFFGMASCQILEQTVPLPGHKLERMLDVVAGSVPLKLLIRKAAASAQAFWSDSPWLLGCGVMLAGFFGALFNPCRRLGSERFKWVVLFAVVLLFLGGCLLGRERRPENSTAEAGNLLVLLLPLFAAYGAGTLNAWLENLRIRNRELRGVVIGSVALLAALPLLARLAVPVAKPMAYPPYHPPALAEVSACIGPKELMVSDLPWAVAWYGDRRCAWLPYDLGEFYRLHDMHQHIAALVLTPATLNNRFLTELMTDEWKPWAGVLGFLTFPPDFFLRTGRLFVGPDLTPVPWEMSKPVDVFAVSKGIHMVLICDHKRWTDEPEPKRLSPSATLPGL